MISPSTKCLISALYNKNLQVYLTELHTKFCDSHDYDIFCEALINYVLDDYARSNETVEIIDEKNKIIEIKRYKYYYNQLNIVPKLV